jgi:hypothetical protein
MKRFILILTSVLLMPVFFSCGEPVTPDNPVTPSNPTTPTTPTNPTDPTTPTDPVTPPEPEIEFRRTLRFGDTVISANGSKDFVAVYDHRLVTKSGDSREIRTGSFTFNNSTKTYSFTGFGKLELLDDNSVAFTPDGGTRVVYNVTVSQIVSDENSFANKMNGSWTIKETIITFRAYNYTFEGLDLNEVEKLAREQGIEFKFHLNDGMVVSKVILTDALMAASFKNGESYAAEHNLRLGSKFKLSEYTNGLEGTATIDFPNKSDGDYNFCTITIDTTLDDSPAQIILTLQKA